MKLTVKKSELLTVLQAMAKLPGHTVASQAGSTLSLMATEDSLRLVRASHLACADMCIDASVSTPAAWLSVPFERALVAASTIGGDELEIESVDRREVSIRNQGSVRLRTVGDFESHEVAKEFKGGDGLEPVEIDGKRLAADIADALPWASRDDMRGALNGITFLTHRDKGRLIASEGTMMFGRAIAEQVPEPVSIPLDAVQFMVPVLPLCGSMTIRESGVEFSGPGNRFWIARWADKAPNLVGPLDTTAEAGSPSFKVATAQMIASAESAGRFSRGQHLSPIKVAIHKDGCCTAEDPGAGSCVFRFDGTSGKPVAFTASANKLLVFLRALNEDLAEIQMPNPYMLIAQNGGTKVVTMLMRTE